MQKNQLELLDNLLAQKPHTTSYTDAQLGDLGLFGHDYCPIDDDDDYYSDDEEDEEDDY